MVLARLRVLLPVPLLLVVLAGVACTRGLPRSRFVASYDAEHENGSETLQLLGDGTYSHRFKATSGTESVSSGKWEISRVRGKQSLVIHNFTPHFPNRPSA